MTAPNVYLLHGDDDLGIAEAVDRLLAEMRALPNGEFNIAQHDGPTGALGEILSAAMAYPFMSDRRLVIVRDLIAWAGRKGAGEIGKRTLEQLAAALPALPAWTRFVLVERGPVSESSPILKLIRALPAGHEQQFALPKDATDWIVRRARDVYRVQIDGRAAAALASVTGNDLRRADNELFKLVAYTEGARPITEADIDALTPYIAETTGFALVDALVEGRGSAAAATVRRLLTQEDQDIFMIYGLIVRQFRLLLLAKEHIEHGGRPAQLRDVLGIRSDWQIEKIVRQCRPFDLPALERIYRRLHQYDVDMKTGKIDPELAVELLIAGLNRE
ncbi:MAG: DNA polymerase III subunit delta [Anaerolinea sp.]|nr:DNA polymerase III subunit delta [Anaerolinea sp.]